MKVFLTFIRGHAIIYVSRIFQKNDMLKRNHFLAAHSKVLLAVYNSEYQSGTAATIRYTQKSGHRRIDLAPNNINLVGSKLKI